MKLDERTMRLIAVGASVSANCQACLQFNAARAREAGIDSGEIAEAAEVGKKVRQGAASGMDGFISTLGVAASSPAGETPACGCAS